MIKWSQQLLDRLLEPLMRMGTQEESEKTPDDQIRAEINRLNTFSSVASGVTVSENKVTRHSANERLLTVNVRQRDSVGMRRTIRRAVVIDTSTSETLENGLGSLRDKFISVSGIQDEKIIQRIKRAEPYPMFDLW